MNLAQIRGRFGERLVEHYLLTQRYKILEKNYNCVFGEVDIISSKGNTLIFVEVKTWECFSENELGKVVNKKKLRKIRKCAEFFLRNFNQYTRMCMRLDVILVKLSQHTMIHYKGV